MRLRVLAVGVMPVLLMAQYRLVTIDPGHFHAALIQKEASADLADEAYVYAPLGPDLTEHLNRVARFNSRAENPTHWKLNVYAGPDWFERMLADRPGQVAVLSGRNKGKIERMQALAMAGMHVLADKPWVIEPEDLPKVAPLLEAAKSKHVIFYDGMTQRYEITCLLQKALVNDPGVFGEPVKGSPEEPGVYLESVHHLLKLVAGAPNLRPPWFFDIREQGEGLTDAGTHLVDLVQWTLTPEQMLDPGRDIRVLDGTRWPMVVSLPEFQRVTGEREFPAYLSGAVQADGLHYFCNNSVLYTLRGVHVKLDVKWGFEAAPGKGDTEVALYRGTKSRIEVRDNEVWVIPADGVSKAEARAAVHKTLTANSQRWPGLSVEETARGFRIVIPAALRIGQEAHFALLTRQFLDYVKDPASLPQWESSFLKAKYFVTTQGVALARRKAP
jgi:predicted dehydrogenase